MRAVENPFLLKGPSFRGRYIGLKFDNKSVVCYIDKQGDTLSPALMTDSASLPTDWTSQQFLSTRNVRVKLNVLANMLSRSLVILKTEWRLHNKTFALIWKQSLYGTPTTDLFAIRLNTSLPGFILPYHDSLAVLVDPLVFLWPYKFFYAFPPPAILSNVCTKTLQKYPKTSFSGAAVDNYVVVPDSVFLDYLGNSVASPA